MKKIIEVKEIWKDNSYFDNEKYKKLYAESIKDPETFWSEQASSIDWIKPFSKGAIKKVNFSKIEELVIFLSFIFFLINIIIPIISIITF